MKHRYMIQLMYQSYKQRRTKGVASKSPRPVTLVDNKDKVDTPLDAFSYALLVSKLLLYLKLCIHGSVCQLKKCHHAL